MDQQLEYLLNLQEIDNRIVLLDKRIEKIPNEILEFKQDLIAVEDSLGQMQNKLEVANKDRRKKERELEEKEGLLSKYKMQQLSVKTNKEYDAIRHEMSNIKEQISDLEEDIINLIDEIEIDTKSIEDKQKEVERCREDFNQNKSRIEKQLDRLKNERQQVINEKNVLESKINSDLLGDYYLLYKNRGGIAVVETRDNACLGCNMRLMSQLFQEIIAGKGGIIKCPNCQRILFYKDNKEDDN